MIALIEAEGRIGLAIPGDLRDETFCQDLVEKSLRGLGRPRHRRQQCRPSTNPRFHSRHFHGRVRLDNEDKRLCAVWITKAALPHLKPGSAIIATASEQAYHPSPDLYDYAQTKAATMNFVKSLAKQLGPKGIRVNGVADLDSPAGDRWRNAGKAEAFRGSHATGPRWSTRGIKSDLRSTRRRDASLATGQIYGAAGGSGQP